MKLYFFLNVFKYFISFTYFGYNYYNNDFSISLKY